MRRAPKARLPACVDVIDERRLDVRVADPIESVAIWIAGVERVLGFKRKIAPERKLPIRSERDARVGAQFESVGGDSADCAVRAAARRSPDREVELEEVLGGRGRRLQAPGADLARAGSRVVISRNLRLLRNSDGWNRCASEAGERAGESRK